jgi:hypothetical protein
MSTPNVCAAASSAFIRGKGDDVDGDDVEVEKEKGATLSTAIEKRRTKRKRRKGRRQREKAACLYRFSSLEKRRLYPVAEREDADG